MLRPTRHTKFGCKSTDAMEHIAPCIKHPVRYSILWAEFGGASDEDHLWDTDEQLDAVAYKRWQQDEIDNERFD